ncbi:MAG: TIGR01906 family membrane protein [Chloroflexi bacterium]|nr:TIGR01906 family membrane protein [Chloroflexota bacterium]
MTTTRSAFRLLAWAAAALFILAWPVFLVTTNVRWAFNNLGLYTYGFHKYGVGEEMGVSDQELRKVAQDFIRYFNDRSESLDIQATVRGVTQPLFNSREVQHMRDVKGLVRGVFRVQAIAGGLLLAYVVVGLAAWRRGFLALLARRLRLAGLVSLALLLVAGVALAVAFPWIFYLFHILSFSNDFWQLDPSRDNLVRLFPQGFWSDATMFIALTTAVEALALAILGHLGVRLARRAPRPAPAALAGQASVPHPKA